MLLIYVIIVFVLYIIQRKGYDIMLDFTADIKYSKEQSSSRKQTAISTLDEIFMNFIRSEENAVIVLSAEKCSFVPYDRLTDFLLDATHWCYAQNQNFNYPHSIEKNIISSYYTEFSIRFCDDFICFVVDDIFYCIIKKF